MATNFVQAGDRITVTAPDGSDDTAVSSGDGLLIGSLFGVCVHDAETGAAVTIQTSGVWTLPKTSAQAWAVGNPIYWTGSECTTSSGGNTLIGVAVAVAANPSSTGTVLLTRQNV